MGAGGGLNRKPAPAPTRVFYDGACGLCQGAVRFAARRDRAHALRFAPLGGPTFLERVPASRRAGLPDGLVLLDPDGTLWIRAEAVVHLLGRLDGIWPLVGALLTRTPRWLREGVYGLVARHRRRGAACVLGPPADERFEP